MGLSIVTLLLVFLVKSKNIEGFKEYWVFDPVGLELSLSKKDPTRSRTYFHTRHLGGGAMINLSSFIDACHWIQKNTPVKAAFFNPAYIRPFRSCTKRQGFVEEKLDGNAAIVDRRFATIFHKRFADIHKGLSYNDFPGYPVDFDDLYTAMRQQYLSLNVDNIKVLKEKYPGYQYFFTEKGHMLPYSLIYRNEHFLLYDLIAKNS